MQVTFYKFSTDDKSKKHNSERKSFTSRGGGGYKFGDHKKGEDKSSISNYENLSSLTKRDNFENSKSDDMTRVISF